MLIYIKKLIAQGKALEQTELMHGYIQKKMQVEQLIKQCKDYMQ